MQIDSKLVANPVVVLREEFDDWAVLYNPDTAEAVGLSPTGVTVWKLLDGERTVEEVTGAATLMYAEVPASAGDEVRALLEQFAEGGFAAVADGV